MSNKRLRQQQFNKVIEHLHTQQRQAMRGDACVYRQARTGYKCAIGALLPDDAPRAAWSFIGGVSPLLHKFPQLKEHLGAEHYEDREFLVRLQDIHDAPSNWVDKNGRYTDEPKDRRPGPKMWLHAVDVAQCYGLSYKALFKRLGIKL